MLVLSEEQLERWSKHPYFTSEERILIGMMQQGRWHDSIRNSADDGSGQMGDLMRQAWRINLIIPVIEEQRRNGKFG